MPLFNNVLAGAAGQTSGGDAGYKIERSLRFDDSASSNLSRQFVQGNQKKWTWSAWVKRSKLADNNYLALFTAPVGGSGNDGIFFRNNGISLSFGYAGSGIECYTGSVFRDTCAWYNICVSVNTDEAVAANRIRVWVNNQLHTLNQYPSQGATAGIGSASLHHIGLWVRGTSTNYAFGGYMADVHYLDGIAITSPEGVFGEYSSSTGVWDPIEYTGNYTVAGSGSNYLTEVTASNGFKSSYPVDNMFDGSTSTVCENNSSTNNTYLTWTPTTAIQNVTSLRVYATLNDNQYDSREVSVNGGSYYNPNVYGSTQWWDLISNTQFNSGDTLTEIKFQSRWHAGGAASNAVRAIEVNGTILQVVPAAPNGFKLDFSDNSSTSQLGKNTASTETVLPCVDFDGNDHLEIQYHSDFALGNSDFTIECYAKTTDATTNYPSIVGKWESSSASDWDFRPASDDASHNFFFIYRASGSNITVNSGTSVTDGKWHHLAVSRQSSNLRMFVDGALVHTHNIGSSTIQDTNMPLYLGYDPYGSSYYNGQTSNLRIVKGTALYTAAFTKPTTPLTNVSNTKLLCFQSDSSITEAAVKPLALAGFGDPQAKQVGDGNNWTANNVTATAGTTITSAKIYSVYKDATVGANYSVQYSDDNSNWTTAFSGQMLNNSVCGLVTGTGSGNGSYGAHKYWKYVIGSTITSHHPRCSRILLSDGTNDYAVRTFTSDNCSDSGGIPQNGDSYTYTSPLGPEDLDSLLDSPTNYQASSGNNAGNYATLNLLDKHSEFTTSNGDLDVSTSGTNWRSIRATIGITSGKYYWEFTTGHQRATVGIALSPSSVLYDYVGNNSNGWSYLYDGNKYHSGSVNSYGSSYGAGDTIGVAFDADAGNLYFYKNGTIQNSGNPAYTGLTSGPYFPAFSFRDSNATFTANFGQRPFLISSIPPGYKSLCTQNLDNPPIANSTTAFDAVAYTGSGGARSITLGFSPDLVWTKQRSGTEWNYLIDTVRGNTKALFSNATNSDYTTNAQVLTGFNSNGYSLGSDSAVNGSNSTYVAWAWDAGSSTVSNTDGSITANVRANTSTGFSIIQFLGNATSGASVGHGLSSAPELVIGKNRGGGDAWWVWAKAHSSNASKFLKLNTSGAETSTSAIASNTAPSNTVITLGSDYGWNSSQSPGSILFAFSPVPGFSSFGTYEGNGSTDGPFIYTGFRVALLVQKRIDSSGSWAVKDAAREPHNVVDTRLYWDGNNADMQQSSFHEVDFLANGFKVRSPNGGEDNANGGTFLYLAFAESPLKYSRAR